MQTKFGKLCATARDFAGYTQESASPVLNVSPRSISTYECGKAPIPEDVILKMMEIYNAKWLGYMYLKMTNKVGELILPSIEHRALSANILDLQVEMEEVNKMQMDLARVGRDDKITTDETPLFNRCIERLISLCGAIFAIAYMPLLKEKSPVLAHRRL
ncbi:helix-turn-helix domain-containing protein [Pelosinus baikalensis]|jgi:transcriptional regulator with XRE-family HTH domain|uniref:Helix-turn-helix transcriptional regulator n=1 Tax=Pelosinus baikalensis TaxID=2892015 RepID=A0ABS8HZH3_9FIRM|nr:helix-turn-helix transcriptional regulator [Pelosinus baikalensis]MCC5468400.1 helix-turn-helix transcriptional regulator [Pelosinus baikalensis]